MKFRYTIIKCKHSESEQVQKFLFDFGYYWTDSHQGRVVGYRDSTLLHRHIKSPLPTAYEYYIIDNDYRFARYNETDLKIVVDTQKTIRVPKFYKTIDFTVYLRKEKLKKIQQSTSD